MSKNQTEDSRLESTYGGGFITAAQRLAELVCERRAHQKRIRLPNRFWRHPDWHKEFIKQIRFAHILLKLFSFKKIIAGLNSSVGKNLYSLGIKKLQAAIIAESEKDEVIPQTQIDTVTPRSYNRKKSAKSPLTKLDE